jgi:hypothetical protein
MPQPETSAGADNRPPPSSSPIPKAIVSIPINLAGNKKGPSPHKDERASYPSWYHLSSAARGSNLTVPALYSAVTGGCRTRLLAR